MADLRFLNIRFNCDSPLERAIFHALAAYPAGVRSQVVREALATHLGIEITAGGSPGNIGPVRRTRPSQLHIKKTPEGPTRQRNNSGNTPAKVQENSEEKFSSESMAGPAPSEEQDKERGREEAVKGLLSMLH